jgi:ElaB/YqjD/DUF883 family membrane-anchored ribosome-binding protein
MAASDTVHDAVQDAQSQIAALRKQVNQLMHERVTPKLADAADRAEAAARHAGEYTKDKAEVVATQVRGSPLIAVAIAGAIGYLLGRFVR